MTTPRLDRVLDASPHKCISLDQSPGWFASSWDTSGAAYLHSLADMMRERNLSLVTPSGNRLDANVVDLFATLPYKGAKLAAAASLGKSPATLSDADFADLVAALDDVVAQGVAQRVTGRQAHLDVDAWRGILNPSQGYGALRGGALSFASPGAAPTLPSAGQLQVTTLPRSSDPEKARDIRAISRDANAFFMLPPRKQRDPMLLDALITTSPGHYSALPKNLRQDPILATAAVLAKPSNYRSLPSELKKNAALAAEFLTRVDGSSFDEIPKSLHTRALADYVLERSPALVETIPAGIASNAVLVEAIEAGHPRGIAALRYPQDKAEILMLLAEDTADHSLGRARGGAYFDLLPRRVQTDLDLWRDWANVDENLRRDFPIVNELLKLDRADYDSLRLEMLHADVGYIHRFPSVDVLNKVLLDRRTESDEPVALWLATTRDKNQAFAMQPSYIAEVSNEYRVLYFEVQNLKGMLRTWTERTEEPSLVILSHHGYEQGMALGANGGDEWLDADDVPQLQGYELEQYLADDPVIILDSCLTGSGHQGRKNAANAISLAIPGATVVAPDVSVTATYFQWGSDHLIDGAKFAEGTVYRVTAD